MMKATTKTRATKTTGEKHRDDPTTRFTTYRVYRLGEGLRAAVKARRIEANVPLRAVLEAAVSDKLPILVQGLAALGITGKPQEKRRPARLPMSDSLLGALTVASKQTGLPACQLLLASLGLLCGDGAKAKGRKGRKS
jgi:hypothetical protein